MPTANQAALSNEAIAQNEERLKRLEEELLKTLDVHSTSTTVESPQNSSVAAVKITDVKAPSGNKGRDRSPPPPVDQASLVPAHEEEPEHSNTGILKEIEQHPALQRSNRQSPRNFKEITAENDSELSHRLSIAESQVEILSRELDITRKRLRSAETDRGKATQSYRPRPAAAQRDSVVVAPNADNEWTSPLSNSHRSAGAHHEARPAGTSGRSHSSEVASIAVDRAPLRIGPGQRESALLVMSRDAQVTIEYRTGEWYRVITDAGTRGWLSSGALLFDVGVPSTSTVRIGGFRRSNEPFALH